MARGRSSKLIEEEEEDYPESSEDEETEEEEVDELKIFDDDEKLEELDQFSDSSAEIDDELDLSDSSDDDDDEEKDDGFGTRRRASKAPTRTEPTIPRGRGGRRSDLPNTTRAKKIIAESDSDSESEFLRALEEDEDPKYGFKKSTHLTARQRSNVEGGVGEELLELPTGGKKKKSTNEEDELRRSAALKKKQTRIDKRLEENKVATIKKLLTKQPAKVRKDYDADTVELVVPKKIRYTQRVIKPVKPLSPKSPKRQSLSPRKSPQRKQQEDDAMEIEGQKVDHGLRKRSPSPTIKSPRSPLPLSTTEFAVPKVECLLSFPTSMVSDQNSGLLSKSVANAYPTPKPCVKCGKPSKYSHAKRNVRICSLACYQKL